MRYISYRSRPKPVHGRSTTSCIMKQSVISFNFDRAAISYFSNNRNHIAILYISSSIIFCHTGNNIFGFVGKRNCFSNRDFTTGSKCSSSSTEAKVFQKIPAGSFGIHQSFIIKSSKGNSSRNSSCYLLLKIFRVIHLSETLPVLVLLIL